MRLFRRSRLHQSNATKKSNLGMYSFIAVFCTAIATLIQVVSG